MSRLEEHFQDKMFEANECMIKAMKDIADTNIGLATTVTKYKTDDGVLLIHNSDIQENQIVLKSCEYITEEFAKKNEKKRLKSGDVITVHTGDVGTSAVVTDEYNGAIGFTTITSRIKDTSEVCPEYLCHYLNSQSCKQSIAKMTISDRSNLNQKNFDKIMIPIPSMEIQRRIVNILDNFTEVTAKLTSELTSELTARKQQYEYYRDKLFDCNENFSLIKLGDIFPFIRNGFVGTVTPFFTDASHGIRYLKGTNIHDGKIEDNDITYVTKDFHQKHIRTELKSDDILMVQSGHVGECAVVGEKYSGSNCHALIVMSNGGQCNSKYIVHYFHSKEGRKKLEAITTGGTVKHILASEMKKLIIPIPSRYLQDQIVDILDNFDIIFSDLGTGLPAEIGARKKQYEYYRDKLFAFKEKTA